MTNSAGLLRPGMYAQVELAGLGSKERVVTVPDSAVIYSGRREIILVELSEGRYEARVVKLGIQGDDFVEVIDGIGEGEKVVLSANFLIDAESNLKAVIAGFTQKVEEPLRGSQAEKKSPPEVQNHTQHKH
jgi:Cu(I)/Ag(I) efflux system membrane fusion protein